MKVDFETLKTKISLPDFLLKMGWRFAPGSSPSSPKMTDGQQSIVIKKNSKGQYTYWDPHSEIRGKSILDFMQQHMYEQTGKMPTFREVGEVLQTYLNNNELVVAKDSKYAVNNAALTEDQLTVLFSQLKPYCGDFLQRRGISQETLSSPTFLGTFYSRKFHNNGKIYNNTCVLMINEKGFQGISQRGIREEDHKSFKGFLGSKDRCIASSKYDKSRPIDQVYIGESMIDNASHFQIKNLNTPKNILYVSTEGNMTVGQMEVIKLILDHHNIKLENLISIFDNDKQGYKYAIKLDDFLNNRQASDIENMTIEQLKEKISLLTNIELPENKDWNDDLQIMQQKNKDTEFQEAIKKNDYFQLSKLKDEGYQPSKEVLQSLGSIPDYTMVAIQKIFDLKEEISNVTIVTQNDGFSQSKTMCQEL